jgi:hypothetical protein
MMHPIRAKSHIVVLGNHEDRAWTKPEKDAPVLRHDSMRLMVSMAMECRCFFKQGDCKNAFCQGIVLPEDEIMIVKPPIGDPDAKEDEYWLLMRTLYGLHRSPCHWYTKFNAALNTIGLHANSSDPCLFTGYIIHSSNPDIPPASSPLTLGLYIDDFIYFLEDPNVEHLFEQLLSSLVMVNFMGTVKWFLGTHFQWSKAEDAVLVHLSQTGFAAHLVEDNNAHLCRVTPDATPYRSGLPINAIPESDKDENCPTFVDCKQKYQSVVGSIGWLASSTQPDLAACHSFLLVYNNKPFQSHWNAALYVLHYIHSTINYGITFTSKESPALHAYMLYPHASDTEAYMDALPPKPHQHHHRTTYSNACWGSQLGNAIREGIQLPLFKFRSMSGAIVMRSRGPISWKAEQQEWSSLSLCEAEIQATNTGSRLTVNTCHMISSLLSLGYPICDKDMAMPLYNDNNACVKWCHNMTIKGN